MAGVKVIVTAMGRLQQIKEELLISNNECGQQCEMCKANLKLIEAIDRWLRI